VEESYPPKGGSTYSPIRWRTALPWRKTLLSRILLKWKKDASRQDDDDYSHSAFVVSSLAVFIRDLGYDAIAPRSDRRRPGS